VVLDVIAAPPIERATANDMMQLATDVGPVPMQVGAVLVLDADPGLEADAAREVLAARIAGVPRLRQRLVRAGFGCGRPVWVDDETFAIDEHIHVRPCPSPGDEAALLACATGILGRKLPLDRSPWDATILTGLADGSSALIVVFNHVLADGIGGLAVLASLVDGQPTPDDYGFPRPAPLRRALAVDAASVRLKALARWREGLAIVRDAVAELRPAVGSSPPRCSLNRPTGARRATAAVHVDLDAVHAVARSHDATINDVVLTAVTAALGALLRQRGEDVDHLVVSIPISARAHASSQELGNAVGVLPIELPLAGALDERLTEIARRTRTRKSSTSVRGSSAALLGPLFRAMARLGVLRWFIDHQRLINTLVTNVHGPDSQLTFAGATIRAVTPISVVTGNVTVAFAVLSYAGTLTITINTDADALTDLGHLTDLLAEGLAELARGSSRGNVARRATSGSTR
jgi:WS/DGAT/MGAT family acyltransferase